MKGTSSERLETTSTTCCITITFGEVAENHVGMQKVGELAKEGFCLSDLENAKDYFELKGCPCELIRLNDHLPKEIEGEEAYVLIVRGGVDVLYDVEEIMKEQLKLEWDTKAKMRGRVVNKKARYNLVYGKEAQEPDYENGKGRIVSFSQLKGLNRVRQQLSDALGKRGEGLVAEGNLYYDVTQCGIGFHGDAERKRVVALRLGSTIPLHYQWFNGLSEPIGERIRLTLNHGDMYVMSEKATGWDTYKRKKKKGKEKETLTLRHAAGAERFLSLKKKRKEKKEKKEEGIDKMEK